MPTINLTLPVAGNGITAGLHATNYAALQALLNGGLDGDNIDADTVLAITSASLSGTAGLVLSGAGGKDTLNLSSTTTETGFTIGGDVNYYRLAADVGKTDDSFVVAGILSVAGNYGTSLPASPLDGMEYVLVDSLTAPTYQWKFRYNAGSASSFKWELIGGSPALSAVETEQGTASTSFVDLATVGPSVTAPRAGEYQIEWGVSAYSAGTINHMYTGVKVGAAATANADAIDFYANVNGTYQVVSRKKLFTAAAADVLKLQYRTQDAATTGNFGKRWLSVLPARVS